MTLKSVTVGLTTLVCSFALLAANSGCEVSNATSRTADSQEAGSTTGGGVEIPNGSDEGQQRVLIDGSSTVYPISQAVAEEFQGSHPNVKVVVGTSGTGGGFKKFVA
ncbi:MAG: phosphate transport system substrate-binding protein, partial [Planctomycetaceae bacterium]